MFRRALDMFGVAELDLSSGGWLELVRSGWGVLSPAGDAELVRPAGVKVFKGGSFSPTHCCTAKDLVEGLEDVLLSLEVYARSY